jgi:hypothetical protein
MSKLGMWLAAVFGVVLFATGIYVIVKDVHMAGVSHTTNAWLGGGMIVLSLMLIVPAQAYLAGKKLLELIGPYLPKIVIGGRRSTDPTAEEAKALPAEVLSDAAPRKGFSKRPPLEGE